MIPHLAAQSFATGVLFAPGARAPDAARVAASLVESDLRGHGSHGVRRLVPYDEQVRAGSVNPRARPSLVGDTAPAVAIVDGADGFGQLTAHAGVDALLDRAPRTAAGVARSTGGAFVEHERFVADVEAFRDRVQSSAPRPAGTAVLVPGEPEWQARERASRDGLVLPDDTVVALDHLATEPGIPTLAEHTISLQEEA